MGAVSEGSFMVETGHNHRKNGCCVMGESFRLHLELKAITPPKDVQRLCRVRAGSRVLRG